MAQIVKRSDQCVYRLQIERVERFVSTVNGALRQRDNQHQLVSLATARIESYDAIEAPNDECVKVRLHFFDLLPKCLTKVEPACISNFAVRICRTKVEMETLNCTSNTNCTPLLHNVAQFCQLATKTQ